MKKIILSLLLAFSFLVASRSLKAGPVINNFLSSTNQLVDFDEESITNATGTPTGATALAVGTILTAVVNFSTLNGALLTKDTQNPNYQFTAISQIQVLSAQKLADGNYDFVFGAVGSTLANPSGTMVSVYEDPNGNFDSHLTVLQTISSAETGTLISTFGISTNASAQNFWIANDVPNDIGVFNNTNTSTAAQAFRFGLSMLSNPGGLNLIADGTTLGQTATVQTGSGTVTYAGSNKYDLVGSGQLYGTNGFAGGTNFQALSHTNTNFASLVPEPSSIVLLSLGGVGVFGAARRRRRAVVA